MQPPKPRASWILNQPLWIAGSLVLSGPRPHSYCLLWFIRRCTWLFDVSSREVSHLLEKWGRSELWNKMRICQNGSDRWICGFLLAHIHVWVCVHSEVTPFFVRKHLLCLSQYWRTFRFLQVFFSHQLCIKDLTWEKCFHQRESWF